MLANDIYRSIRKPSQGLFKDNGSRFIAFAYPVKTEVEVKEIIAGLRSEYHDARHCCYAYRLGADGTVWRASDDGEPSGTAGRRILAQIDSKGLSDILIAVVRYYGGINLGIPGLIRAYKTSAADALGTAEIVEKTACIRYRIEFPYDSLPAVMKLVKDMAFPVDKQSFLEACSLEVNVRLSLKKDFLERIEKINIFTNYEQETHL